MACYGVPSCNLSVMEFGGPEAQGEFKNKVNMDNCSYALKFGNSTNIGVQASQTKAIEIFFNLAQIPQNNLKILSFGVGDDLTVSGSGKDEYGKLKFGNLETSLLPIFNGRYMGVCMSNNGSQVEFTVMQTEGDRVIFYESISGSATVPTAKFIGASGAESFSGSVDEFRMWNTHLSSSIFRDHVFYPEMINGNHISASTTDLDFRLDFEYPKNLTTYNWMLNVAPAVKLTNPQLSRNYYEETATRDTTDLESLRASVNYYNQSGTPSGFLNTPDWPYDFEPINRDSLIEIPDIGVSRYSSNKIRFEEQSLISHLSSRHRATKKAIQTGPMDSNRVGIFFSPTKELNFDIAKSMGAERLNEYIGDPSDRYKPTYKKLNDLRNYYFQRIGNRNIYEYIDLVRMYERAMFDDLKKMLPARVKATTGLLIEPHFLERSKYEYEKPTGSNNYYEGETEYQSVTFGENNQFEGIVDADMSEDVFGDNYQYNGTVDADLSEDVDGELNYYESTIDTEEVFNTDGDYYYYDTRIDAKLDQPTIFALADISGESRLAQFDPYSDIGFGLYTENGHGIRTYRDQYGDLQKKRVFANIVVEKIPFTFEKYAEVDPVTKQGDPRGGFITTSSFYFEKKLVVQEWSGSTAPTPPSGSVNNNIVSVTVVNGYLPTHNKFTSDLTTGLQNSYYKGSKNTRFTTIDGTEPVESFTTNPATLKVNSAGRDSTEPILQVE
jgi:hypothetical protein